MRRHVELRGPAGGWPARPASYVAIIFVLIATLAVVAACSPWVPGARQPAEFKSNGEHIYFTATGARGTPITADWQDGMMMGGAHMACADCHGPQGRGGRVQMMMSTYDVPDIRYETLISDTGHEDHEDGEGMEHPPYTDETIKRAITEGVDPAGEPLEWPMPRWRMSDEDLSDLLAFLKSLSQE